jgi:hypothetical protein
MSSENINISPKNISGKCDLKCAYNFKYPVINSTARNNNVMISLTPENISVPPVTYNTEKYNLSTISITCPSVHTFNDKLLDAEVMIEHIPVNGGKKLNVAIPIMSSSDSSTASNLITQVIQSVSTNAPSNGETTNLNIAEFTLQHIVPEKPYFSYTDTEGSDWIVFGMKDYIPLNSSSLTTLGQIIKPFQIPMTGGELFFNKNGPNRTISSGIYISCNPTGSSVETTEVVYETNPTNPVDFNSLWNNSATQIIIKILIACLLFIATFYILYMGYNFIVYGSTKVETATSSKS